MSYDLNNPIEDLIPKKDDAPVTPPVTARAPTPAAPPGPPKQPSFIPTASQFANTPPAAPQAAPAPAAPTAPLTAADHVLQYLSGGSVASGRNIDPNMAMDPNMAGSLPTGGPSAIEQIKQWWKDIQQPKPADLSRPQTLYDWAGTRTYNPSWADLAGIAGMGWTDSLAPLAPAGMRAADIPTPKNWSPEAARAAYGDAWNRAGPAAPMVYGVANALQPANWLTGFGADLASQGLIRGGLRYAPEAWEAAAPVAKRALSTGMQTSALSGAQEGGAGGSPAEIGEAMLKAFPPGLLFGGLPTREGVTPGDVTASTKAKFDAATDALKNTTIPHHELGFEVGSTENPTVQDLLDYKKQIEDEAGDSPSSGHQVVLQDINKALAEGTTANKLVKTHQDAESQYNSALLAQRWMNRAGIMDVPKAAQAEMDKYPEESQAQAPYKAIASVPEAAQPRLLPPFARKVITGAGAATGALAGEAGLTHFGFGGTGYGHLGAGPGAIGAGYLADAIDWLRTPTPQGALVRQEIAKQYGPMTGTALQSAVPLGQALMYLRQGAQGGPR